MNHLTLSIPASLCLAFAGAAGAADDPILAGANDRIELCRKGDFEVRVATPAGAPVAAKIRAKMTAHKFRFGSNIFLLRPAETPEGGQKTYQDKVRQLLNFGTLPFYWGSFEAKRGEPAYDLATTQATWCKQNGVRAKGHPLVWFLVTPKWLGDVPDEQVEPLLEARVRDIVSRYRGLIDCWDVINESSNFPGRPEKDKISEWIRRKGSEEAAALAFRWAREANPDAFLLINDYNTGESYAKQIQALLVRGVKIDAIGIQSHMHKGEWSSQRLWDVCERFGRLGPPIHFTELTILSGDHMKPDDNDWGSWRKDWGSTPDGEARQAAEVERVYRILFSHPKVEAITWWDFADAFSWMAAPAGLLGNRGDKPAFTVLDRLINQEWSTQTEGTCGADGTFKFRGFKGTYLLTLDTAAGAKLEKTLTFDDATRRHEITWP